MATTLPRSIVGICVGVDKPGLLHDLNAAGAGAKQFHEWLLSQADLGVQVRSTLFTEQSGPVTRRKILDAISEVVKERSCDALFIYLAGHGVAHSAYEEKLLLSEVAVDDAEAINLQVAKQRGKFCGIPHVIIIYDACRSFANTDRLRQISGGPIFPPEAKTRTGGHVDVFFACASDESSFEVPDNSGANPRNYKAFFTDILIKALRNPEASLIETTQLAKKEVQVIPSARLERVLETKVPMLAATSDPAFDQTPDIDVLSHMPEEFFALAPRITVPEPSGGGSDHGAAVADAGLPGFERPAIRRGVTVAKRGGRKSSARKGSSAAKSPGPADVVKWHVKQAFRYGPAARTALPSRLRQISRASGFKRVREDVLEANGRKGFETHCGFTIIGAKVRRFDVSNNPHHEFVAWESTDKELHYRVGKQPWDARGGTALIQFSDGSGVALGILPGYVGTVLVKDGHVRAITYALAEGTREFAYFSSRRGELDERRAIATAAASIGKLQELGKQLGEELGQYIRVDKAMDPCLGVLAAYSYYLADNPQQIQSVWQWMSSVEVTPYNVNPPVVTPVPFDVAMLARKLNPEIAARPPGIAPFCPWLSLGWSLFDIFELQLHPAIIEASRHRLPGTWTSFTGRGMGVLQETMQGKEIS